MYLLIQFEPANESLSPEMAYDMFLAREHKLQELIEETFDEEKMAYKTFNVIDDFPSVPVLAESSKLPKGSTNDEARESTDASVIGAKNRDNYWRQRNLAADGIKISESRPINQSVSALNGSREIPVLDATTAKDYAKATLIPESEQGLQMSRPGQLSPTPFLAPHVNDTFGDSRSGCLSVGAFYEFPFAIHRWCMGCGMIFGQIESDQSRDGILTHGVCPPCAERCRVIVEEHRKEILREAVAA